MQINLFASHALEQLASAFCRRLQEQRLPVFQPYYIVTQTEGINDWLRQRIAEEQRIAAHIRFVRSNDIVHRIYQLLGGEHLESLSSEDLSWLLYEILGRSEFRERFGAIAAYFTEDPEQEPLRRYALAAKVADLFDQYQVYREDVLQQWKAVPTVPEGAWQQYLWRCVCARVQDRADKTRQGEYIIKAIQDPEKRRRLQQQMPHVAIFGLSVLTKYHLRIFAAVAPYISFSFYLLNAAPAQYWMDALTDKQVARLVERGVWSEGTVTAGNPLLTGWGKLTAETFRLLFEEDVFLNNYELIASEPPAPGNLLGKLQADVFHNHPAEERHRITTDDLRDGSIEIHSCYTRAREVEVLYNYLVHQVEGTNRAIDAGAPGRRLTPRDILVLVTDIDAYAPYIKAVFGNAPYPFPFSIAGEHFQAQDSLVAALHLLLHLHEEQFDAERVVQLLDSSWIRNRFRIADTNLVRRAVDAANIRFGIEGDTADDTVYVSWKYGIRRLIYGICMTGGDLYDDGTYECYPLELVEGNAAHDLVRFCYFAERVMELVQLRQAPRRLDGWARYVRRLLELLQDPSAPLSEEYLLVEKQLGRLNLMNDWHEGPVPFEVFRSSFLDTLGEEATARGFGMRGVTFSSMIPMRSIPARIIAVLGLSFDKFPRREPVLSFNIMQDQVRVGDRNRKDNDKHLFLETLIAAREKLFISYTGQSVKDNTPLPPSALVDELLDYVDTGYNGEAQVRNELVRVHPLHSFSRVYQAQQQSEAPLRFYSYTLHAGGGTAAYIDPDPQREPIDLEVVELKDLVRFFRNPIAHYYQRVLQIRYDEESELLDRTEVFELDKVQEWSIKKDLLLTPDWELTRLRDRMLRTGKLPLKNMAPVVFNELKTAADPVRNTYQELTGHAKPQTRRVEIRLDNGILRGAIDQLYGDMLLCYSLSRREQKYLQDAWILFLAASLGGVATEAVFISRVHEGKPFRMVLPGETEIRATLSLLLDLYRKGHQQPMPYSPDFGILPSELDTLDAGRLAADIAKQIDGYNATISDPYVCAEFRNGLFAEEGCTEMIRYCAQLTQSLPEVFPGYFETRKTPVDAA